MEEHECQIRNVHPAKPHSQKRAQQSSDAQPAVLRSTGVTGAGSRVSPTSARNADSGDRNEMGNVAVIMRVMPESPEVDLEQLKTALKQKFPGLSLFDAGILIRRMREIALRRRRGGARHAPLAALGEALGGVAAVLLDLEP